MRKTTWWAGIALALALPAATGLCAQASEAVEEAKKRVLLSVEAKNSASYGKTRVFAKDRCEVYEGGTIYLLEQKGDMALVEYRPALVYYDTDHLVDLWSEFRADQLDFCPPGTRFEVEKRLVDAWDERRTQTVMDRSFKTRSGFVSRHLEKERQSRMITGVEIPCFDEHERICAR